MLIWSKLLLVYSFLLRKRICKKSWQVSDHRAWLSSHEAKDDKRMKLKKRRPSWKENAIEKRLGHLADVRLKNVSSMTFLSYYWISAFKKFTRFETIFHLIWLLQSNCFKYFWPFKMFNFIYLQDCWGQNFLLKNNFTEISRDLISSSNLFVYYIKETLKVL